MKESEFLRKYFINWKFELENLVLNEITAWITEFEEKIDDLSLEILAKRKADLYAYYVSITEVFIINFLTQKENSARYLFEANPHNRISVLLSKKKFINSLVNYCFPKDLSFMKDKEETVGQYIKIIENAFNAYLEDFKFLNAYKHWRRILQYWKSDFDSSKGDSLIFFYHKKKDDSNLYMCRIQFNWEEIYLSTYFLIDTIENMRRIYVWASETTDFKTMDPKLLSNFLKPYREEQVLIDNIF